MMRAWVLLALIWSSDARAGRPVDYLPAPAGAPRDSGSPFCYPLDAKPMDLCWRAYDPNGIPLNPFWRVQTGALKVAAPASSLCGGYRKLAECTGWTTDKDLVRWLSPLGIMHDVFERLWHPTKLHGHVNWGAATYTGKIDFTDYESGFFLRDHDYNLRLELECGAPGLVTGNDGSELEGRLGLEFKASETIDLFQGHTTWWTSLKKAVDRGANWHGIWLSDYAAAKCLIPRLPAIVIGLIGIDTEHDQTELHPVWGLAINVSKTNEVSKWAVFARNWGNEGNLSHLQHRLQVTTLCFLFRERELRTSHLYSSSGAIEPVVHQVADGVVLGIPLGPAQARPFVYGELEFRPQNGQ